MNCSVKTIAVFERQAKKLAKKYPSLKTDLTTLVQSLKSNPIQGTALGNSCFKIRLSITSKAKGKSGGARVITNFIKIENTIYLLNIYDKSEKDTITNKELLDLLKYIETT